MDSNTVRQPVSESVMAEKRKVAADTASVSLGAVSEHQSSKVLAESPQANNEIHDAAPVQQMPSTASRMILVGSMFLTLFLPALDQTIVSTALPKIMSSLTSDSASSNEGYTWVGSAYALAQAVVLPLFGQASEAFGRKWTFLTAIVIFMLGSVLCGTAQSVAMLIASRAVQGMGAGGITSLVFILIGDLVGTRKRGKYQGFIGAVWAVASALGPVLGGVFAEKASWRWCFFVNLPVCAACIAVILVFLRVTHPPRTLQDSLRELDFFGIFAGGAATVLLLLAFEWASSGLSWASAQILACLIFGTAGLAGFVFAEFRAPRPVMPLSLFNHRTRIGAYAATFLHATAYSGLNYYTPLFFQGVKGQTASESGVSLLPLVLAFAIVSTGSGYLITATKRYQELIWFGFILATLGCGLLIILNESTSSAVTSVILVVAGIGVGPNFNSLLIPIHASLNNSARNSDIAMSASAYAFVRAIGSSIGISIGGLITFVRLRQTEPRDVYEMGVTQLVAFANAMEDGTEKDDIVYGFSEALKSVFIELAAVMGAGMLVSFLIQKHELGERVRSDHVVGRRDDPNSGSV